MPSGAKKRKVSEEEMHNNLAVLAKSESFIFSAKHSNSNVKPVRG